MHQVLMGAFSALSFGVADFMASQSGARLGALRALTGMLLVSSIVLTAFIFATGAPVSTSISGILVAALHGVALSFALLLFFHAMTIGPINVVAPIVAAHPVFVLAFALASGSRPDILQVLAMAGTIVGVVIVAAAGQRTKSATLADGKVKRLRDSVVGCSLLASLIYAIAIVAAQSAASLNDDVMTLWLGRIFGLFAMLLMFPVKGERLTFPVRWWPFFCLHGALDSAGLFFLLRGSGGSYDEITAVVASTFGVVTMLLAWVILKERMTWRQGGGVLLIFLCVAFLAFRSG